MSILAKIAAIATIVGVVFAIVTYFKDTGPEEDKVITTFVEPADNSNKLNDAEQKTETDLHASIEAEGDNADTFSPGLTHDDLIKRHEGALKIPYASTRSAALFDLAKLAVVQRMYKEAKKIAEDIPYTYTRSNALSFVSKEAAKSGDMDLAIIAAEKIPLSSTKSATLKDITTK